MSGHARLGHGKVDDEMIDELERLVSNNSVNGAEPDVPI